MNIEVKKNTFDKLFSIKDHKKVEKNETHRIEYFRNVNISGFKIWNYVSSKVWQYYLTDINA